MSNNTQSQTEDEERRRLIAFSLIGLSLLPIGWAALTIFVFGNSVGSVLFPLVLGVAHLGIGGYLLFSDDE